MPDRADGPDEAFARGRERLSRFAATVRERAIQLSRGRPKHLSTDERRNPTPAAKSRALGNLRPRR